MDRSRQTSQLSANYRSLFTRISHQKETLSRTSNTYKDPVLGGFTKCRPRNAMCSPPAHPSPRTRTNRPKEEIPCLGKVYCLPACDYAEAGGHPFCISQCAASVFIPLFPPKYSRFVIMDVHLILNFYCPFLCDSFSNHRGSQKLLFRYKIGFNYSKKLCLAAVGKPGPRVAPSGPRAIPVVARQASSWASFVPVDILNFLIPIFLSPKETIMPPAECGKMMLTKVIRKSFVE